MMNIRELFVRDQSQKADQFGDDDDNIEKNHMYMVIKISNLLGFVYDLNKVMYCLRFKLIFKKFTSMEHYKEEVSCYRMPL